MAARRRAGDAIATKTCRTSVLALAVLLAALCDVSGAAAEMPDMSCALGNEASLLRHFLDPEPVERPTRVRRLSVEPATLIVPAATEAVVRFRDGDFFAKPGALQREILVFLKPVEDGAPVPFQRWDNGSKSPSSAATTRWPGTCSASPRPSSSSR